MSLFDDLLPARLRRKKPCLIIGCEELQEAEGLCARHNRNVNERDPLAGVVVPE